MTRPTRLSHRLRKTLLVLHMVCGIGWMGLDIARLVLAVTASRSAEAEVVYSSYRAIAIAFPVPVMLLSFGMELTSIPALLTPGLSANELRASLGAMPNMLLFPPVASVLMLATAVIFSVVKLWGFTPWTPDRKSVRRESRSPVHSACDIARIRFWRDPIMCAIQSCVSVPLIGPC